MAILLLRSLGKSLALTLAVELAAAALLGVRKGKDFLLVALVNVLTNPLLGLILDGLWLASGKMPGWYVILPLEAAVVAVEGLLYRGRLDCGKWNPFVLSAILNGLSYIGGWMV